MFAAQQGQQLEQSQAAVSSQQPTIAELKQMVEALQQAQQRQEHVMNEILQHLHRNEAQQVNQPPQNNWRANQQALQQPMGFAQGMEFQGDAATETAVLPIILIVTWFAGTMLSIANYASYVRFNEDVYGRATVRAHLAFTIIGVIIFLLFSAVCWLWAARYVTSNSERWQKIKLGFWGMFLFHDLPLSVIECRMILCCGWRNPFQGFVYVEQMILFFASGIFAWLSWTWIGAKWMQDHFNEDSEHTDTEFGRGAVMGTTPNCESKLLDAGGYPQSYTDGATRSNAGC